MNWKQGLQQPDVLPALLAALLFGAGTPLAKLLLESISPWLLAGLLYLSSGVGLTLYRCVRHAPAVRLPRHEVLGACLAWGIDNNLTRKVCLTDATWIASVKGLVAGLVNLTLAFSSGASGISVGFTPTFQRARPDTQFSYIFERKMKILQD